MAKQTITQRNAARRRWERKYDRFIWRPGQVTIIKSPANEEPIKEVEDE